MTIQVPNPGTGNGATGDNEFVLWSKVKTNFEDQTNAASRTVGKSPENVALAKDIPSLAMHKYADLLKSGDLNNLDVGTTVSVDAGSTSSSGQTIANMPPGERYCIVKTYAALVATHQTQIAISIFYEGAYKRTNASGVWTAWTSIGNNTLTYNTTTASGANVVVTSTGELRRSTSSERYKDIIADLELDDAAYANAMRLTPIVYRSTANADNPNYHYYSFSAEALGTYDPAFTLWRDTETVTDEDGNVTEQPLDERQAEGINLNAIVAFLHATNIKQGALITDQAEAISTLTGRIDALTDN